MNPADFEGGLDVKRWVDETALPLGDVLPGSGFADLAPLRSWIGDARIVGLGEATHGTREFFQLKHRILEFLVSELGFSLLILEANLPESLAVNRYVMTGFCDAGHSLASLRYWCWDCEEMLEVIKWMRKWNASHTRQVRFYGCDVQSSAPAAVFLLNYLRAHAPRAYHDLRQPLLTLATDVHAADWAARSDAERTSARSAIAKAEAVLDTLTADTDEANHELGIARLHATVLRQHEQLWADPTMNQWWTGRDRAMAENITALLELHGPESRAVVWAHNTHIQQRCDDWLGVTAPCMGAHLRAAYGESYRSFGFAFDHGSFGTFNENYQLRDCTVASIPGTLDSALSLAEAALFALDLRNPTPAVQEWFSRGPHSRTVAPYWPEIEEALWTRSDMRELFDALLFVRETSASHRFPTAFYMFEYVCKESSSTPEPVNLDFRDGIRGWQLPTQPSKGPYMVSVVQQTDGPALEVSRLESCWPWDTYKIVQAFSAASLRGKQVTLRCYVSMAAAHEGSSAQLAMRVTYKPTEGAYESGCSVSSDESHWQRVITCEARTRELCLTARVGSSADTISVALIVTGDGRARFGPITLESVVRR